MSTMDALKASLALGVATAAMLTFVPPASAFDMSEVPLAVDALNTYAPGVDPPPNDGAHDFAVGGGQHSNGTVLEGFSAHSGPSGENPQGHVEATINPPHPTYINADVICLDVNGNDALILSVQRKTSFVPAGDMILTEVVDNGNPVNGTPPDLIRNSFLSNGGFIPPPASGPAFPCGFPLFPPVPLEKGNIVVRDVMP